MPGPEILVTGCLGGFCVRVDGHVVAAELGLIAAAQKRRELEALSERAAAMLAETLGAFAKAEADKLTGGK